MPDFDIFFSVLDVKNVKVDLMVNVNMATLTNYGRHGLFSFLSSLPILV